MNTFPDFAERFKDLISESGLSQKQIACAIGITETSVSNYISGKSEPSLKVLVAIADYFKCTTDYITGKKDESEEKIFLPCPPFSTQLKILDFALMQTFRKQAFTIGETVKPNPIYIM